MGDSGDEGQGDLYEGVYANIVNEKTKQLRSDSEIVTIKNKLYLRSRSVISNWPCLSFYCISELTEGKKENESIVYDMAKDYIESFSHDETFQSMRRFRIETKIQSLYTKTDLTSCLTKRAFLKNSKSSESF